MAPTADEPNRPREQEVGREAGKDEPDLVEQHGQRTLVAVSTPHLDPRALGDSGRFNTVRGTLVPCAAIRAHAHERTP